MKQIIILAGILMNISLFSQVSITGKVFDSSTDTPLEFGEIVLLSQDSQVVTGAILDTTGYFNLKASSGAYIMRISYLGSILYAENIVLNSDKNLGKIQVRMSRELNETTISANKILIQREIDRLVFNVENSSKASQGDAMDVLQVTPGIRVSNDKITLVGKSNMQVMINGKLINLSSQELANFLRSIPSQEIQKIEVITTPPAKYDATGNSGLVNIVLKKSKTNSWNSQMYANYRQRFYASGNGGASFNYNKNKITLASSLAVWNNNYYQEQDDYAYFANNLWYTSSPFKAYIRGINGRLDLNYQITDKWSTGIQYMYANNNYDVTDKPYTPVTDYATNEIVRYLQSNGTMDLSPGIQSINYNNEFKIDTTGKKVVIDLDFFSFNNPDIKTYNGVSVINNPSATQYFRGINANRQDVNNYSAKIDWELPLSWANISFGGKYTRTRSLNNIEFFNSGLVNEPVNSFVTDKNDFKYKENIGALYTSINKEFNSAWSAQVGLRMESTNARSTSDNLMLNVKNDYIKFFPTVYLSRNISDMSSVTATYNRRIQRPGFFVLNPNLYFINPFQTIEGNPFLQPAFIDNIELAYTFKNYAATIYNSYEENMFSQVPLPNSNTNFIRFVSQNFINSKKYGISQSYTFDKLTWWTSSNSLDINYAEYSFMLPESHSDQKGFNSQISTDNDFVLNSSKTIKAGIGYWYNFRGVNGIFDTKPASTLSLYLQFLLLDKKMTLTFRGNDIFKSAAERTETTVNGVFQTARYYYDNRFFLASVSYQFGNTDLSLKKRTAGNQEEQDRTQD